MPTWNTNCESLNLATDNKFLHWLTQPEKLSVALRACCNNLSVKVLKQEIGIAAPDEQDFLEINETNSLVREVYLCGDAIPLVLARVIVPAATYAKYKNIFDTLGNNLIGEHFLYQHKNLLRGELHFAAIGDLFARRRIFYINNDPILITEIFLPNIPEYPRLASRCLLNSKSYL
jgi:chorismate--pyruvate lyase